MLSIILCIIAIFLSFWIAIQTSGTHGIPGCRPTSGCAALAASRWSRWGPIPVSIVGAFSYILLAIMFTLASLRFSSFEAFQYVGWVLAATIAGAGIWFIFLQLAVLRRFCLYCNAVHLVGITIFMMMLSHGTYLATSGPLIWTAMPAILALFLLSVLIVGQLVLTPKMYAVERAKAMPAPESNGTDLKLDKVSCIEQPSAIASTPEQDEAMKTTLADTAREVRLLEDRIKLNTADWPFLGSPNATHLIGLLIDYTCPVCRKTHEAVRKVLAKNPNQLGVLVLPVPSHPACNSTIKKILPGHGYACHYARLAIGVWQARPDRYEEFDRYLFTGCEIPPFGLAIAKASELAGTAIDAHHADERTDAVMRKAVEIYRLVDKVIVPIILFPQVTVVGEVKSATELQTILHRELGLPKPRQIAGPTKNRTSDSKNSGAFSPHP